MPRVKILYLLFCLILLFSSCENDRYDDYSRGYDNAWRGIEEPNFLSSSKYRSGYEQGRMDADMYDDGFYDGKNGRSPKRLSLN
ncbi:MAG: hypothetical protein CMO81_00285 [Waddliaceae bacterium]|nr:hypothetical protein [Waddliaceae bacterium]|tara:strand:+ start:1413 stop:1664 length:252 start_codon:yes stop_codon:yes gene_type:complete